MAKFIGLSIVGIAVFMGAVVVAVTKRVHEEKSVRPGESGFLQR